MDGRVKGAQDEGIALQRRRALQQSRFSTRGVGSTGAAHDLAAIHAQKIDRGFVLTEVRPFFTAPGGPLIEAGSARIFVFFAETALRWFLTRLQCFGT